MLKDLKQLASGLYSHAEGDGSISIARGDYSHAEGTTTQAIGQGSHAEGWIYNSSIRILLTC
jgi:trimeric autotransporter adhesin